MARDCTVTAQGCVSCPTIPGSDPVPAQIVLDPQPGWNAGANSIAVRDGVLYARNITAASSTASAAIGFRTMRINQVRPETITHGVAFLAAAGQAGFAIIEYGQIKTTPMARSTCDRFELRRYPGGLVRYYRNDTQVYQSSLVSAGPVVLTCCLFFAGDMVGGVDCG